MAFAFPTEVLPKALATGLVAWGAFSYFFTGPEVAARVAQFDHLQVCQANYEVLLRRAAEAEMQALPPATSEADIGMTYLGDFMDNPFMRELGEVGGFGGAMSNMMAQVREKQRATRERYERGKAEIEANTRRKLANSEGFCGCVADTAIDKSRNDWALFAGSLGLFSSSKVENFGEAMTNPENVNACHGSAKGKA